MPIDISEIQSLLESLAETAKHLQDTQTLSEKQRQELALTAEKVAIAAREPEENVYHIATQVPSVPTSKPPEKNVFSPPCPSQIAQNAALRSAIAMGAFEAIPSDGTSISANTLAKELHVNKDLLGKALSPPSPALNSSNKIPLTRHSPHPPRLQQHTHPPRDRPRDIRPQHALARVPHTREPRHDEPDVRFHMQRRVRASRVRDAH
ncbi:hypothetical protein V494_00650 [Pseudogymnoascus sp. VKM F-4513 (FW-928)]|nr:hypothetical protein V494_00650 [Pseudogymnoascus sp. VKM F-4513 (FW-928)]